MNFDDVLDIPSRTMVLSINRMQPKSDPYKRVQEEIQAVNKFTAKRRRKD
jgi:hypothetical protein